MGITIVFSIHLSTEALQENITLETMFVKHIIGGNATLSLCPCTAFISDFEECNKAQVLKYFLSNAVQTKNEKVLSPLMEESQSGDEECMSCYKVIILGSQPFDELTWMIAPSDEDRVVMCLLSYFACLCKKRNQGSQEDCYELLEFAPLPATNETINIPSELNEQLKLLYVKLKGLWESLESDENLQAVLPSGVGLLNIFNVGNCKAAHDFRPFLNKYCKRSVNIACYNSGKNVQVLKEFDEENDQNYYSSTKCKLLKQLSGCIHKEQIVTLAAIDTSITKQESQEPQQELECNMGITEQETQEEDALSEAVQRALKIENIHHLQISCESMMNTKSELESSVLDAPFYKYVAIQLLLLMHRLKNNRKSFWIKRCEIESLSKPYEFDYGDLERFLQLFSSFGNMFYTHDIPSLREYIIIDTVEFVKHLHDLYTSREDTAKYGLFKYRGDDDWKIIFEFITTLGIAVEVKSNQIKPPQNISLDVATPYYYIPSARSASISSSNFVPDILQGESASSGDHSITYGYIAENLQVLLCKKLLLSTNHLLIPTKSVNTTIIRFCDIRPEEQDVEFIDMGDRVVMSLLNAGSIDHEKKREIYSKAASILTPHLECTSSRFSEQSPSSSFNTKLSEVCGSDKQRLTDIPHRKIVTAAKKLAACTEDIASLVSRFKLSQDWIQDQAEGMDKRGIIVNILHEYKERTTPEQFSEGLKEFDIHLDQLS